MIGPKEKKERALGTHLFLKAHRCNSAKCAVVKRPTRPGIHGASRRKAGSEYGQQLSEKQKIMFSYNLKELQMRKIFKEALSKKQNVTESIVQLLERRLDNTLYRTGFAPSRITARQYINHGHIKVNGKKVTIPSFRVRTGDVISIKPNSKDMLIFKELPNTIKKYDAPAWIVLDKEKMEAKIKALPHDVEMPFDINLVVDFYSTK